jgi:hypothetical protein
MPGGIFLIVVLLSGIVNAKALNNGMINERIKWKRN